MPGSLYDELLGEAEIEIECPGCEKTFTITINQVGSSVICPHCKEEIKLEKSGDGFSDAESALNELEDTLNSF